MIVWKVIGGKTTAASNGKDCTRVDGKQVQVTLSGSKVHGRYIFLSADKSHKRLSIHDRNNRYSVVHFVLSVSSSGEKDASVFSREEAVWHLFLWAVLANQKEVVELFIYESSCKIGKNTFVGYQKTSLNTVSVDPKHNYIHYSLVKPLITNWESFYRKR